MNQGWIKLHRKILEWEWYTDLPTRTLFFHLLLKANHTDKKWKGVLIKRGTVLTGINKLSQQTGLTPQQVRTAKSKLKSTNEITIKSTSKYSLIELLNYDVYQQDNNLDNKQATSKQQASNKQATTTKNDKNDKNEEKKIYGEFKNVKLLVEEYEKLVERFGGSSAKERVEKLSVYLASKGDKYKSHYATIINWAKKDGGDVPEKKKIDFSSLPNVDI